MSTKRAEPKTINTPLTYDLNELKFKIENHIYLLEIMPTKSKQKNGRIIERNDGTTKKEVQVITKLTLLDFDINNLTISLYVKSKLASLFKKIDLGDNDGIGTKQTGYLHFRKLKKGNEYSLKIWVQKDKDIINEKIYSSAEVEVMQTALNYAIRYIQPTFLPDAIRITPD